MARAGERERRDRGTGSKMSAGWSSQRKVVCRDWVQPADMQESVLQRGAMEYPAWLRNLAVCRLAQSHRLQETDVCTCLSWTKPAYKTDLSPSWRHIWCPPVAKPEIFNFTYMFVPTFRVRGQPEQSCGSGFWRRSGTVAMALDLRMKSPSEENESDSKCQQPERWNCCICVVFSRCTRTSC